MLIKQLKNFFVGKCGLFQFFFVSLHRILKSIKNYELRIVKASYRFCANLIESTYSNSPYQTP